MGDEKEEKAWEVTRGVPGGPTFRKPEPGRVCRGAERDFGSYGCLQDRRPGQSSLQMNKWTLEEQPGLQESLTGEKNTASR